MHRRSKSVSSIRTEIHRKVKKILITGYFSAVHTYILQLLNGKKHLIIKTAVHHFYHKVVPVTYKHIHFPTN